MSLLARRLSQSPAFNLLVVLIVIGLFMLVRLGRGEDFFSASGDQQAVRQTAFEVRHSE